MTIPYVLSGFFSEIYREKITEEIICCDKFSRGKLSRELIVTRVIRRVAGAKVYNRL